MSSAVDPAPDASTLPTGAGYPRVGTSGSSADTGYRCVHCQKPIQNQDRFCSYCGYSTKKCAACRNKLQSAGDFCPYCGAARSGQQIIRTPMAASRAGGIGSFLLKYLAAPAAAVLIATLIVAQPAIPRSTALVFFKNYFTEVTNAKQRPQLYAENLSTSFKQFTPNAPAPYNSYRKTVGSVSVDSVFSVPGNSYEFAVSLTIRPKAGGTYPIRVNYWLICTGFFGNLWGRIPGAGCPEGDLKIDNEQSVPIGHKSA
jgi:Double zinc ribbon